MSLDCARKILSAHLVSEGAAELNEVEYGLIVANNSFALWCFRGIVAAVDEFPEAANLWGLDAFCLYSFNHPAREKKPANICFSLNNKKSHIVNYDLKKLVKPWLAEARKQGKEVLYVTVEMGRSLCFRYREIRMACIVGAFSALGEVYSEHLADIARQLRVLSRLSGQSTRIATNL